MFLQETIDAQANAQATVVGLDVNVGGRDPDGVLEHRLDQLDDGRVRRAFLGRQRLQIDVGFGQLIVELLGQRYDLLGAPVHEIDRAQQRGFLREREPDRLAEQTCELVESEQVGRVGHADEVAARVLFQHERAMPPRLRLRQLADDLRVERHVREIDVRNVQRRRERAVQIGFGDRADVDQHAAELAAAAALLRERLLQLLLRDQLLLEQQIAEANALARFGCHGGSF